MGWIIIIAMAAAIFGLLWKLGGVPRVSYELIGAALLLGMAGYAWQGHPGTPGSPLKSRQITADIDPSLVAQRKAMMGQFGTSAQWLDTADTYGRLGSTRAAVAVMQGGVEANPRNADLWVGMGNALVNHGGGMISPAAQMAFDRAAKLSPEHPAPPFFMGMALAQSGQFDRAAEMWGRLLMRAPADAPWREDLEMRLAMLLVRMGKIPPEAIRPRERPGGAQSDQPQGE